MRRRRSAGVGPPNLGLGHQEASPGMREMVVESFALPRGCYPPGNDVCKGSASPAPGVFI
eukprot:5725591-Pyramimonas_sp.AAC.2